MRGIGPVAVPARRHRTPSRRVLVRFLVTAWFGGAAMLPIPWHRAAKRAWWYVVYNIGYRLLSVQLSCASLAVSGVPFVIKHA
ncbi:hypothetical protein MB901379_03634 [Mycobacterium basiliense]|uniref:Uncharacterized protein n=1 Tax=Mycobacterium basiliense TaxID=2094119 RepID=A0A447GHR9_9MYCO|nr:hypothetical protein [Mycobacterium basiliense]VDM90041.1 hypothetical protein MB901379_03634 [Mycobacterium basiliense]